MMQEQVKQRGDMIRAGRMVKGPLQSRQPKKNGLDGREKEAAVYIIDR